MTNFLNGVVAKAVAVAVVLAAAGSGVALAADGAIPGDALYGIDRALEAVGIRDGGPHERAAEALERAADNLPDAVATAAEAASEAGSEEAADALRAAADTISANGSEQSQDVHDNVVLMLQALADGLEADGVVGSDIAALARAIGGGHGAPGQNPTLPEQVPDSVPADPGTPGEVPPVTLPPATGTMPAPTLPTVPNS